MTKLMQITVLVPTTKVHDACMWLERNGATAMMVKAVSNGHAEPEKKSGSGGNNIERGKSQTEWLVKRITGKTNARTLKDAWEAEGYARDSIYPALVNAVKRKAIRKVSAGVYAPRGRG